MSYLPYRLPYLFLATVLLSRPCVAPIPSCGPRLSLSDSVNASSRFVFYEDSPQCVQQIVENGGAENSSLEDWNVCGPELLHVELGAYAVVPQPQLDSFLPYTNLNLSVTVFSPRVERVFVRLHCVHAPDADDAYCHALPAKHMEQYGRMIWPCRGVYVEEEARETPYTFSFDCFRLFPYSRYFVNVTAFPSGCSTSFSIVMPPLAAAMPEVHAFYEAEHKLARPFNWTPILIVDFTSSEDGVWLRFVLPSAVSWRSVILTLYESKGGESRRKREVGLRFIREFLISFQKGNVSTGVKWEDAPAGDYELIGHVERHDCSLSCEDSSCTACPSSRLPFHLSRSYLTRETRAVRRTRDVAVVVLPVMLVLLVLCTAVVAFYVRHIRRKAKKRIQDIPLVERPRVLLLYSDDCPPHEAVAKELASVLAVTTCSHVAIDQVDLMLSGGRPARWLVEQWVAAKKILVLLSPSTPELLAHPQRQLRQLLPFPDLLAASFPVIMKELSSSASCPDGGRVAFLRLSYSPPLPQQFAVLGARCFCVPEELARVASFVHGLQETNQMSVLTSSSLLDALQAGVAATEAWLREQGEGWLQRRMEDVDPSRVHQLDLDRIAVLVEDELRGEERLQIAEDQGMLMPDEQLEEEEPEETAERTADSGLAEPPSSLQESYRRFLQRNASDAYGLLPPESDSEED